MAAVENPDSVFFWEPRIWTLQAGILDKLVSPPAIPATCIYFKLFKTVPSCRKYLSKVLASISKLWIITQHWQVYLSHLTVDDSCASFCNSDNAMRLLNNVCTRVWWFQNCDVLFGPSRSLNNLRTKNVFLPQKTSPYGSTWPKTF